MIQRKEIAEKVDCRDVVQADMGKPKAKTAKTLMYQCPFHGEHKGVSLAVYADGWKCFGKCSTGGDVVSWLERRRGLSWQEACRYLVDTYHLDRSLLGETSMRHRRPARPVIQRRPEPAVEPSEPPGQEWQFYARLLVDQAQKCLWSKDGSRALAYLMGTRGLNQTTIKIAHLGYIPADKADDYTYGRLLYPEWQLDGKPVRAHCGIVIPHFADGQLWAVRIRRPPGIEGAKYMGIRGGSKALYWVDEIMPGYPIIIVEGEFDCLVIEQCAFEEIAPVAIASASNKHINPRWLDKLISAPVILSRMDGDGAGAAADSVLRQLSARIRPVQVPDGFKDVNELLLGCGPEAVRQWIVSCL